MSERYGLLDRISITLFVLLFPLLSPPHLLHVDRQFPALGSVLRTAFRVVPLFLPCQRGLLLAGVRGVVPALLVGGLPAPRFLHLVERRKQ